MFVGAAERLGKQGKHRVWRVRSLCAIALYVASVCWDLAPIATV